MSLYTAGGCWKNIQQMYVDENLIQIQLSFTHLFSMDYIISGDRLGNNMQKQDPTMLHFTLIQGRRVD